jgi:D-serine deaminase-like pyridoxal phosphate-dependent protein
MASFDPITATHAVRPGAYVFGDLLLSDVTGAMAFADAALTILATVVDRPEPDLALLDAGSKVFGQDRTADVCPVVNLTSHVLGTEAGQVLARWTVDTLGCVT